jgi:hypothetical protein
MNLERSGINEATSIWASQGAGTKASDAVCLIGPPARCRDQLAAFRAAGLDLPILHLPIRVRAAGAVIGYFGSETHSTAPCTPGARRCAISVVFAP